MKACPECKIQFGDEHEFCPRHGLRLTAATLFGAPAVGAGRAGGGPQARTVVAGGFPAAGQAVGGPGAATVFFNQSAAKPKENYDRLIGTILDGRYQLLEIRGEGGMGVVFKARHTVIEKIVAVKILKREVASDRQVLQRFVQEARAASRIGHWAIVDVSDFGTLPDGSAYQVMEFITGDTLAMVMKKGPLHSARAVPVAAQMARALAAAHDKGIVHRDLKPENIFLTEKDGRPDMVKIVDFGIAKFAPMGLMDVQTRITRVGAVFGTPEYMAPEQAAGRSDTDHRVDIYALGVILYEMIVGQVPHKGDSVVATLAQQMLDPVVPPRQMNPRADCGDRLEQVILTMLAKDRDRRYQSMFEVWQALEWVAEEMGIVLEAPGGPPLGPGPMGATPAATPPGLQVGGRSVTDRLRDGRTVDITADGEGGGARVLWALAGVIGVAGLTVGLALALRQQPGPGPDTGGKPVVLGIADAGPRLALAPPEAPPLAVTGSPDGGAAVAAARLPDAGGAASVAIIDDGMRVRRPPDPRPPPPRPPPEQPPPEEPGPRQPPARELPELIGQGADSEVVITTRPRGASLYLHGLTIGSDGVTLRRPRGTRMQVRCLFPGNDGWEPGTSTVTFDGQRAQVTCEMEAKTRCVKDIKNPFKNCPM